MDSTVVTILRFLSDGKIHSIDCLTKQFTLSQVEILQKLRTVASELEIDLNDQYCYWKCPLVWLDKDVIISLIQKNGVQQFKLVLLDCIDSTNNYLKSLIKKNSEIKF